VIVVDRLKDGPVELPGPVVASIGNFDGVHVGHRAIMGQLESRASELGGSTVVITFSPHPLRILAPERAPRLLSTREQKLELLEGLGVGAVYVVPFDRTFADMPAESFVLEVLVRRVQVSEVLVGPDFRFGRGRAGDVRLLQRMGAEHGFSAAPVAPVLLGGERISASRIRDALSVGDVADAARLLGRPFALAGTIVHGEGRGRSLLFPTANLSVENEFLPARGVYISRTSWSGGEHTGLTNVGIRPTFGDRRLVVETFLPGFEGDLYGERASLALLERLRDERKFSSPEDLRGQIERDIDVYRRWLASRASTAGGGP
jgi:riboflavin kinase/FMN adenylyltransferase